MQDHVFKTIEITGVSTTSSDEAVRVAIAKASESIRHIKWFQIIDTRGYIENARVVDWQVTVKIGFRLLDD